MSSLIRRNKPVLIVDNYPDTLDLLRLEFQQHGFEVLTAPDAPTAIQIYESVVGEKTPCLAILDAALGASGTGYTIARKIRELDKSHETVTVIYTAYDVGTDPLGLHPEVDAVLRKPMGEGQLLGEILRVAELKERVSKFKTGKDTPTWRNPQNRLMMIGFAILFGLSIVTLSSMGLYDWHCQIVRDAKQDVANQAARDLVKSLFDQQQVNDKTRQDDKYAQMQQDINRIISLQAREGLLIQDTRDALLARGILKDKGGKK